MAAIVKTGTAARISRKKSLAKGDRRDQLAILKKTFLERLVFNAVSKVTLAYLLHVP